MYFKVLEYLWNSFKKQSLKCVLQKRYSGNFKQDSSKVPVIELISCKWVMSLAGFKILFVFWSCKRSTWWRHHFFEYEIYHYTESSSFLKKYYMLSSSKSRRFHWRYQTFCRKWYLIELEKVTAISNILFSS